MTVIIDTETPDIPSFCLNEGSAKLVLPLPHKALSPNARVSWRVKSQQIRLRRTATSLMIRAACPDVPEWKEYDLKIYWLCKSRRWVPDKDNAFSSCKSTIDGIEDSNLIENDFFMRDIQIDRGVSKEYPRVELTITRVDS